MPDQRHDVLHAVAEVPAGVVPRRAESAVALGGRHRDLIGPGLREAHAERAHRHLVVEQAELALQLLDLGLHAGDAVLHGDDVADVGGLRQHGLQPVAGGGDRGQPRLQVRVLRGHLDAAHALRLHRPELAQVGEERVELRRRHPHRDRPARARRRERLVVDSLTWPPSPTADVVIRSMVPA